VSYQKSVQGTTVHTQLTSSGRHLTSLEESTEMVRQAKILGQTTAQLIEAIKVPFFFRSG